MYKFCKTEQSAARQRQLEQGLLAAMLEHRYEDISVSDLCQRMNIPRKAFYRYFSGKDGALFALIDHSMLDFYTSDLRNTPDSALGDLKGFFLFWHQQKDLLDALQGSHLSGLLIERATLLAQQEKLMPRKIMTWSTNLQSIAMSFAISGLMTMVFQWHRQGYHISPAEITDVAINMLSSPLIHINQNAPHIPGD